MNVASKKLSALSLPTAGFLFRSTSRINSIAARSGARFWLSLGRIIFRWYSRRNAVSLILVYFAKIFRVASSFAKTNLTASLLQVNAAGGDLTYVAFFGSKTDYALFSTKDITEVKQLRGKRLGRMSWRKSGRTF